MVNCKALVQEWINTLYDGLGSETFEDGLVFIRKVRDSMDQADPNICFKDKKNLLAKWKMEINLIIGEEGRNDLTTAIDITESLIDDMKNTLQNI